MVSIVSPLVQRGILRARRKIIGCINGNEGRSDQALVQDKAKAPKIMPAVGLDELIWEAAGSKRETSGGILMETLNDVDLRPIPSWLDLFPELTVATDAIKKIAKRGLFCFLFRKIALNLVCKLSNVELIDNLLSLGIIRHRLPVLAIFHVALKVKRCNHHGRNAPCRYQRRRGADVISNLSVASVCFS